MAAFCHKYSLLLVSKCEEEITAIGQKKKKTIAIGQ
jgi:hypothetical protein